MSAPTRPTIFLHGDPLELTAAVGVASSSTGGGGTVLDPTIAGNADAIAQNIRLSFAAFEDDDGNGIEDHRC